MTTLAGRHYETTAFPSEGFLSQTRSGARTSSAEQNSLLRPAVDRAALNAQAWQKVIDRPLLEWATTASDSLWDDEMLRPTEAAIDAAIAIAREYGNLGIEPPTRVVPDGLGGISFEREDGEAFEQIQISPEGVAIASFFHEFKCHASAVIYGE